MNSDLDPHPKPVSPFGEPVSPNGGPVSPQEGPTLTIYVANMAEDVWQLIGTLPPDHKATDIRGCELTSDRELMSFLDTENFLLISPLAIDPLFIEYANSLKRKNFLEILVPASKTGRMSLDVMNDPFCVNRILELSHIYSIHLESYTASSEFIGLVKFLQAKNPSIAAPLTPQPEHKSVVDYFGSKSGLRTFYEQHHGECPEFIMAKGKVCAKKIEANTYAR